MAGPDPTPRHPVLPAPPASDRLDSWKEIAAYLKREIRTVQRWEKREGLPVHRHVHTTQGTVFAYKAELDVWWNNGHQRLEHMDTANETTPLRPRLLRWPVAIAAGVLLTATMALGLWFLARPGLDFEARDWVLIADFENQTGGAIADGTVEYALAHALGESRFVNVVPRARVVDTLGLMRRPPETAVDAAVGREIALRDGGIRAILSGRVDKLDTTYALSAVLVEPATGRTVASVREEAAGDSEFLPAVHRLSNRVRARLGEALADIERSARALEKVTTPSLSALQLFSEADALIPLRKSDVAEELLRQAVAEDPDFASGYMHLAFTIRNQGRPAPEYLPPAERAVALAERVSERERYFILGSYHQMLGMASRAALDEDLATIEDDQAVTAYEALLRLYPDHYWGSNNLAGLYSRLGRAEEEIPYLMRLADLRPKDFQSNFFAAQRIVQSGIDTTQAQPYLQRARALASSEGEQSAWMVSWLTLLPVWEHWLAGDPGQALAELERATQTVSFRSQRARDAWINQAGDTYLTLGALQAAEEMFRQVSLEDARRIGLAEVAWARGDLQAATQQLGQYTGAARGLSDAGSVRWMFGAMVWPRFGDSTWALEFMTNPPSLPPGLAEEIDKLVRGQVALTRGETVTAITLLEESLVARHPRMGRSQDSPLVFFLGSESLARAWEQHGDVEEALRVLENASAARRRIYLGHVFPRGMHWLRIEAVRARLARELGRQEEAARIEAELLKLLAVADPDHVILRELKRLS